MQILLLRYTVCLKRVAPVLQLEYVNPLSANPTKWPNTVKQFVEKSRRIV